MEELKPCPFCGSSASVSTVDDEACSSHDVVPWYAAGCDQCGAHKALEMYRVSHKDCKDLTGHPDALKSQAKDWRCDACKIADKYLTPSTVYDSMEGHALAAEAEVERLKGLLREYRDGNYRNHVKCSHVGEPKISDNLCDLCRRTDDVLAYADADTRKGNAQ